MIIYVYIYIYLDLLSGAEWMMFGVPIHHPLEFKQYPLENASIY